MKRYKQQLFEMANIPTKRSGLQKGYIQIRVEPNHPRFAHIHYVYDLKKQKTEFVKFNIGNTEDKIYIVEQENILLTNKEIVTIKKFIIKNYKLLLNYYFQGEFLDTDTFMDSIKKV